MIYYLNGPLWIDFVYQIDDLLAQKIRPCVCEVMTTQTNFKTIQIWELRMTNKLIMIIS